MKLHPTLKRYSDLRAEIHRRQPPSRDGMSMVLEGVNYEKGTVTTGSHIDSNPVSTDVVTLNTPTEAKGVYKSESFVEVQRSPGLWATLLGEPPTQKLYHLARTMTPSSSGYSLADVCLTEFDLGSNQQTEVSKGDAAIVLGQALEDRESLRLYLHPRR